MVRMALIFMLCAISSFAYDLQYHPLLLQVKDKHGETLAKALDKIYGDKIAVQKNRCHYFEMTKGSDTEYEIDRCKINYTQQKVYSQADRLNGIEIKGSVWIEGNSYRTRVVGGDWNEWKSTELFSAVNWHQRTGFEFRKKNGEFEFTPTRGVLKIRGSSHYIDKNRTKEIKNGTAPGILIQESGTGKIVIQESR